MQSTSSSAEQQINTNKQSNSSSGEDTFHDTIEDTNQVLQLQNEDTSAFAVESDTKDDPKEVQEEHMHAVSYEMDLSGTPGRFVGINSFADAKSKQDVETPAPLYFTDKILLTPLPIDKPTILKGIVQNEQGALVCTDVETLQKQQGVLANVAKQLVLVLLKGLSISHISLPIKIFEPRSSIQRIVDFWSSAPLYLTAAAKATDPVERMANVIAFSLSNIYICTGQNKPFNPLLGETNQGTFPDGTKYYCEHTSHHPPISHFLVEHPEGLWKLHGYYEFIGKMGKNSLTSGLRGPNILEFKDGSVIRFNAPDWKLGGTIFGDRTIEGEGSIVWEDLKNKLRAVVCLGTYKSGGFFSSKGKTGSRTSFQGIIYKVTDKALQQTRFGKDQQLPKELDKLKGEIQTKICDIEGNWLSYVAVNKKQIWHIDSSPVNRQIPMTPSNSSDGKDVLPSDWRFREDLIWLKYGFQHLAANWKIKLEVQQRKDRKLRHDVEDLRKKKTKK